MKCNVLNYRLKSFVFGVSTGRLWTDPVGFEGFLVLFHAMFLPVLFKWAI